MDTLKPPGELLLTGNLSENWKRFKQKFELYLKATGKSTAADDVKTALCLHVMGEDALDIYNGFTWETEGDDMKLDKVLKKFEDYCIPKRNLNYERYKFFSCSQKPGENIEQFVSELQNK